MSVVAVIATLKVQPGKETELESVFRDLAEKVRANEKGCLQYELFKPRADASTYYVLERYASRSDVETHMNAEYFKSAMPALGATLAAKPEMQILVKVA